MPTLTLRELAGLIGGTVLGDPELRVDRPCPPDEARNAGDIAVAVDPRLRPKLSEGGARAAVLADSSDWKAFGLEGAVLVPQAKGAMVGITRAFAREPRGEPGIHPSAIVDSGAEIGARVRIGPFSVIGKGARIGDGACILGAVSVGEDSRIGTDGLLHPGVRVGWGVTIGDRSVIHANACIGVDGFAMDLPDRDRIEKAKREGQAEGRGGRIERIHSLGGVLVGDDVEIGACTAIDRGTLSDTTIGDGVKIDNLVHVAHNVRIGPNVLLCGQVGIAGSARIGEGCVLGGQVGVGDHVRVGEYCLIGGKSMVAGTVKPRTILSGWASLERKEFHSVFRAVRRLARRGSGGAAP